LHKETRVAGILTEQGRVVGVKAQNSAGVEMELTCCHVLSSMPLRELIPAIQPKPPDKVVAAAECLSYRDFITVALVLDTASVFPDNWIYIHSPEVRLDASRTSRTGVLKWCRMLQRPVLG
jgi:protoporphyrinogen oxidase